MILKYSDPFAIERDVESIRAQRHPPRQAATATSCCSTKAPDAEGPQANPPALAYQGSCCQNCGCYLTTDGDTTFVYELMSIGNEPPWRYSDPFRIKLRIHTKRVDTIT